MIGNFGNFIFNVHWPNNARLIQGFCTVREQPWVIGCMRTYTALLQHVTPFLAFSKWYISISAGNRPQPPSTCLHEKIQASDRASVRCLALCEECYQTLAQGNKEEGHARAACMDSVHCKSPWWCAASCKGDAVLLMEKWQSIQHHIVNIHRWTG